MTGVTINGHLMRIDTVGPQLGRLMVGRAGLGTVVSGVVKACMYTKGYTRRSGPDAGGRSRQPPPRVAAHLR